MKLFTTVFLLLFSQLVNSQSIPKNVTKGIWIEKEYVDSVVKYHKLGKYVYNGLDESKKDSIKYKNQLGITGITIRNGYILLYFSDKEARDYSTRRKNLKFNKLTNEYIIKLNDSKLIDSSKFYLKYVPQNKTISVRYFIRGRAYLNVFINNFEGNYFQSTPQHVKNQIYIHGDYDLFNEKDSLLAKGVSLKINNIIKYFNSEFIYLSLTNCPKDFSKSKFVNGNFYKECMEGTCNELVINLFDYKNKIHKSFIYVKVNGIIYLYQIDTIKYKIKLKYEDVEEEREYLKRGKLVYKLVNQKVK